jgi:hypothetical protein
MAIRDKGGLLQNSKYEHFVLGVAIFFKFLFTAYKLYS